MCSKFWEYVFKILGQFQISDFSLEFCKKINKKIYFLNDQWLINKYKVLSVNYQFHSHTTPSTPCPHTPPTPQKKTPALLWTVEQIPTVGYMINVKSGILETFIIHLHSFSFTDISGSKLIIHNDITSIGDCNCRCMLHFLESVEYFKFVLRSCAEWCVHSLVIWFGTISFKFLLFSHPSNRVASCAE